MLTIRELVSAGDGGRRPEVHRLLEAAVPAEAIEYLREYDVERLWVCLACGATDAVWVRVGLCSRCAE